MATARKGTRGLWTVFWLEAFPMYLCLLMPRLQKRQLVWLPGRVLLLFFFILTKGWLSKLLKKILIEIWVLSKQHILNYLLTQEDSGQWGHTKLFLDKLNLKGTRGSFCAGRCVLLNNFGCANAIHNKIVKTLFSCLKKSLSKIYIYFLS